MPRVSSSPSPSGIAPHQSSTHAPIETTARPASPPRRRARPTLTAQRTVARLRDEACERARPAVQAGTAPIRVMARMVTELQATCRAQGIAEELLTSEVVNRTIGDVDLRRVSAENDGPEFVSLADDMGLALPGERIGGTVATGAIYLQIRERMMDFERQLLARGIDVRMYDLGGIGNLLLREQLAAQAERQWGVTMPPAQVYLSLGALDGLDKFLRGFAVEQRRLGHASNAVLFPAPSFNVPEWQATSLGLRLHRLATRPDDHFKVTPEQLRDTLDAAPDIRLFYLTVSNNPTAFAYTPDELRALFAVLRDRDVWVLADLAYIGTGVPAEDRARMAAFADSGIFARSVLVSSFSKTHTFTGDRFGWVAFGDADLAMRVGPAWTNSTASLPAEWQLRYLAVVEHFQQHPELLERIRALYSHRRTRLVAQLRHLDAQHHIFAQINLDDGGTVYNWSQLRAGEDVFSLFSKTGIAGVPGSAFGYSDDYVRLSIGCLPVPSV